MGWKFGYARKDAMVRELLSPAWGGGETIAHVLIPGYIAADQGREHLWAVKRHDTLGVKRAYIALFLLERTTINGRNSWGYKELSEHEGPTATTCPPEFFGMAGEAFGYAKEWREKVIARQAKRGARPLVAAHCGPQMAAMLDPQGTLQAAGLLIVEGLTQAGLAP
jgi:hypothetical protein